MLVDKLKMMMIHRKLWLVQNTDYNRWERLLLLTFFNHLIVYIYFVRTLVLCWDDNLHLLSSSCSLVVIDNDMTSSCPRIVIVFSAYCHGLVTYCHRLVYILSLSCPPIVIVLLTTWHRLVLVLSSSSQHTVIVLSTYCHRVVNDLTSCSKRHRHQHLRCNDFSDDSSREKNSASHPASVALKKLFSSAPRPGGGVSIVAGYQLLLLCYLDWMLLCVGWMLPPATPACEE